MVRASPSKAVFQLSPKQVTEGAGVAPGHWLCRYTIKIPPPAPKGAKAAVSAQDHWLMVGGKLPCG